MSRQPDRVIVMQSRKHKSGWTYTEYATRTEADKAIANTRATDYWQKWGYKKFGIYKINIYLKG